MRPLADQPTREMFFECTSVWVSAEVVNLQYYTLLILQSLSFQVEPDDHFPQQMCSKCWFQCKTWSDFKALAMDSDRQLRFEKDAATVAKEGVGEVVEVKDEESVHSFDSYSSTPETEEEEEATVDPLDRRPSRNREQQGTSTRKGSSTVVVHKPFECKVEECNARFTTSAGLRQHALYHSKNRPFQCDECDRSFHTSSNLNRHKLIHSGVKAFECDECDKKFTLRSNLVSHKESHSKIPHKCHLCGKQLKSKRTMRGHMRRVHQ